MATPPVKNAALPGVTGTAPTPPVDKYQAHNIKFDEAKLTELFVKRFSGYAKFAAANGTNLVELTRLMAADPIITDVRWMAYMLATAYWETAVTVAVKVPKKEKGKPVLDKAGQPVMRDIKQWQNMAPSEETGHGAGWDYAASVKVLALANGSAEVMEPDGDTFLVAADGSFTVSHQQTPKKKGVIPRGVAPGTTASAGYASHKGKEHAYYGRGYVQLTWWNSYAATGAMIGRGLDLLLDPELVMQPAVAYKIMSVGMTSGDGFANGHTLSKYFSGLKSDYVGARAIINGSNEAAKIADIARSFEGLLLDAKVAP